MGLGFSPAFGLFADALLALLDDFFWHAHQDQTRGQFGALADQHLPLPGAITDLRPDLLHIQRLPTVPIKETHQGLRTREKKALLLFEPFSTAIADHSVMLSTPAAMPS